MKYLDCVVDAVTALPVDVVIGGVFLGLLLTSPVGLAYAMNLRRKSQKDMSMGLLLLAMAANIIGMAIAIGHVRYLQYGSLEGGARSNAQPGPPNQGFPPPGRPRFSDFIADKVIPPLFLEWDTDHDGKLTTAEASAAAAALIKSSASDQGDFSNEEGIRKAFAEALEIQLRAPWQRQAAPQPTEGKPSDLAVPRS